MVPRISFDAYCCLSLRGDALFFVDGGQKEVLILGYSLGGNGDPFFNATVPTGWGAAAFDPNFL